MYCITPVSQVLFLNICEMHLQGHLEGVVITPFITRWWFHQPIWKMLVKLDLISPRVRDENIKNIWVATTQTPMPPNDPEI